MPERFRFCLEPNALRRSAFCGDCCLCARPLYPTLVSNGICPLMFDYLVRVTETSFCAAIILGAVLGVSVHCSRRERRFILIGIGVGAVVALAYAVLKLHPDYAAALYALVSDLTGITFRERYMVREYYNLAVIWPALVAVLVCGALVVSGADRNACPGRWTRGALAFLLAGAGAHAFADLFLYPFEFSVGVKTLYNADVFLNALGYGAGLVLALLLAFALARVTSALSARLLAAFFGLVLFVYGGALLVDLTQALYGRTKLLKDHAGLVIWLMTHASWFLYALMALAGSAAAMVFLRVRLEPVRGGNPALVRKHKARVRLLSRWSLLLVCLLAVVLAVLTVVKDYVERPPEIAAAVPVNATNGNICVPLGDVEDGNLHRFVFKASDGTEVRFLVIRKSASAYGIGLDACDICGASGYYQRGDLVICNRCDVAMNISTIGFPSGCNPVPLSFTIEDSNVVIDAADLEKEKRRFR